MTRKTTGHEQLQRIADALDEHILNASAAELREELISEGLDEHSVIAEMDSILEEAKKSVGKSRFEDAKAAVSARTSQSRKVSPEDRERVRGKLASMRSGADENVEGMMLAARKGKKLSKRDEEGALDDLAQLEALESEVDPKE